jgi:hypothetical protein
MVVALHIWFNFIIIGPVHVIILILQIGFNVDVYVFFIIFESILFSTCSVCILSVQSDSG